MSVGDVAPSTTVRGKRDVVRIVDFSIPSVTVRRSLPCRAPVGGAARSFAWWEIFVYECQSETRSVMEGGDM